MPQGRESVISDQVDVIGRRCSRDGLKLVVEASFSFCGARFPSFTVEDGKKSEGSTNGRDIVIERFVCVSAAGCFARLPPFLLPVNTLKIRGRPVLCLTYYRTHR